MVTPGRLSNCYYLSFFTFSFSHRLMLFVLSFLASALRAAIISESQPGVCKAYWIWRQMWKRSRRSKRRIRFRTKSYTEIKRLIPYFPHYLLCITLLFLFFITISIVYCYSYYLLLFLLFITYRHPPYLSSFSYCLSFFLNCSLIFLHSLFIPIFEKILHLLFLFLL